MARLHGVIFCLDTSRNLCIVKEGRRRLGISQVPGQRALKVPCVLHLSTSRDEEVGQIACGLATEAIKRMQRQCPTLGQLNVHDTALHIAHAWLTASSRG
jgi:hypothetical protein